MQVDTQCSNKKEGKKTDLFQEDIEIGIGDMMSLTKNGIEGSDTKSERADSRDAPRHNTKKPF